MLRPRIIPILLIDDGKLVKTIQFKNPKYIGDPLNTVRIFNEKEVDELVILDITNKPDYAKPNLPLLKNLASECFMPLCYGGGVSSVEDIKRIFSCGIEKVSINSMAFQDASFLSRASAIFGTQSIVLSIDVKKSIFGEYKIYSNLGKKKKNINLIKTIHAAEELGVGEILLSNIKKDGTMSGYDLELYKLTCKHSSLPIVACGGASDIDDLKRVCEAGASAASAGSLFVFYGSHRGVLINYPTPEKIDTLLS